MIRCHPFNNAFNNIHSIGPHGSTFAAPRLRVEQWPWLNIVCAKSRRHGIDHTRFNLQTTQSTTVYCKHCGLSKKRIINNISGETGETSIDYLYVHRWLVKLVPSLAANRHCWCRCQCKASSFLVLVFVVFFFIFFVSQHCREVHSRHKSQELSRCFQWFLPLIYR